MHILESSFRYPSEYVFNLNDKFYRAVHSSYKKNLYLFERSRLYSELLKQEKILSYSHQELDIENLLTKITSL